MNTTASAPRFALSRCFRRGSKSYDLLAATPLMLGYAVSATATLKFTIGALRQLVHNGPDILLVLSAVGKLGTLTLLTLLMAMLLLRRPPVSKACGVAPRIAALVGTYLAAAIPLLPASHLSPVGLAVSAGLIFGGTAFAIYAVLYLGRSFSLMAEARRLITSGPYARIRHPLYLGEEIAIIGMALQFLSFYALALLALQMVCQLYRMQCEERVLAEAFPDYRAYKTHTFRLLPGVY